MPMKLRDIDLSKMLSFDPEAGQIHLDGERMLLFRQESFRELRRLLFDQLGPSLTRSVLTRFGYQCGKGDYELLKNKYEWDSPEDLMGAGPVLHAWEGHVHVTLTRTEFDPATGHVVAVAALRNSYEADIHLQEFGRADAPVCYALTGHASGYSSAALGMPILAVETQCRAMGHEHCEVETRPLAAWDQRAKPWREALEHTEYSLSRELERKIAVIEAQAQAISELSTPIMEIWDDVLVLPIIGIIDTRRSVEIMEKLLNSIVATRSRCVIIDVTGVEVVDTKTADYLIKVVRAARLLGSYCVLTGLSPAVAHTLVAVQADLQEIRTLRNLKEGLKDCLRFMSTRT